MGPFEKALQKVQRQQMTHEDRGPGDRRVRDALKTMGDLAYDTTSLPFQMLTYSPEAEGAFIGPKGIERLKKAGLGDKMKEFTSRFFGDRAEINPSDAANVWWRMGNPLQKMDEILKSGKSSTLLQDIIHPEEFPELFTAYPKLKNMKVDLKPSQYEKALKAAYVPPSTLDINFENSQAVANRFNRYKKNKWRKENPEPKDQKEYTEWADQAWGSGTEPTGGLDFSSLLRLVKNRMLEKSPGKMSVSVPEQMNSQYPSQDIIESLLHESQHYIQKEELGTDLLDAYNKSGRNVSNNVLKNYSNRYNDVMHPDFGQIPNSEFRPTGQGLEYVKDPDVINDIALRNWIDSLGWREKSRVQGEFSGNFWPPSAHNYEVFRRNNPDLNAPDIFEYRAEVPGEYTYKMNPYEREAFEASKRDIDPQYRNIYKRKTEE